MATIANKGKTVRTLNAVYECLNERAVRLVNILRKLDAEVEWGWYAGHTVDIKDELVFEAFPIPVITIKDICEIGVDIDGAFVEGKLYSKDISSVDFSLLKHYNFSVYGAENYLEDMFNSRLHSLDDIASMLLFTNEEELCVNVIFDSEPDANSVIAACAQLRELGTHVLTDNAEEE